MKAILFNPNVAIGQPISRKVNVQVGGPGEAYVILSPAVGSVLAGEPLPDGKTIEVPLTFFHGTKHFARGSAPDHTRLELPVDLPRIKTSDTTDATLFHFGALSTIVLNGTAEEELLRFACSGIGGG